MEKPTDVAREHYRNGRIKEALRIAKTFRLGLTKEEKASISRAYECFIHSEFYKMIGKNIEEEIEKGKTVFERKIA